MRFLELPGEVDAAVDQSDRQLARSHGARIQEQRRLLQAAREAKQRRQRGEVRAGRGDQLIALAQQVQVLELDNDETTPTMTLNAEKTGPRARARKHSRGIMKK